MRDDPLVDRLDGVEVIWVVGAFSAHCGPALITLATSAGGGKADISIADTTDP